VSALQSWLHKEYGSVVYVSWKQDVAGSAHVEHSLDGELWEPLAAQEREAGTHEELLLGIPYGVELRYRVVLDADEGPVTSEEGSIATRSLPEGMPLPEILTMDEAALDPSLRYLLVSLDGENSLGAARMWSFIFDRQGEVLWARQTPSDRTTLFPQVSPDGADLLIDHNSFWSIFDGGAASQVLRMKIDGSVLATYDTPGMHHPFTSLPDGSVLWASTDGNFDTLMKLTPEGEQEALWSCEDFHASLGGDWFCGSNTISWDEATDSFLFSIYSTASVVEIDHASGETLRWFGYLDGAWGFEPEDSAFFWQHGVHYTEAGTMLMSARLSTQTAETVVREYELDHEAQLLRQVWSFGEGEGIYAPEMGEAHRLGNGNTLHNLGAATRLREVTSEGEVVWDVCFSRGTYLGRSTPLEDLYALAP